MVRVDSLQLSPVARAVVEGALKIHDEATHNRDLGQGGPKDRKPVVAVRSYVNQPGNRQALGPQRHHVIADAHEEAGRHFEEIMASPGATFWRRLRAGGLMIAHDFGSLGRSLRG